MQKLVWKNISSFLLRVIFTTRPRLIGSLADIVHGRNVTPLILPVRVREFTERPNWSEYDSLKAMFRGILATSRVLC